MSSLKILGDHAAKLRAMVKQHGGYYGAFKVFKRTDELKEGKLIGEDQFGNKYYENNYYFKVIFDGLTKLKVNGSGLTLCKRMLSSFQDIFDI